MNVDIEPDEGTFRRLERALMNAADGREFFRDLERSWRAAASVAANDARRSARMISAPRSRHEVSLRSAIASGVRVHVSTGIQRRGIRSKVTGDASVAIAWHRSSMKKAARGKHKRYPQSILWRAGSLLNKGKRWSHPVFGLQPEVVTGVPQAKGWFDDSIEPHMPGMVLAIRQSYEELADRIETRSRGR